MASFQLPVFDPKAGSNLRKQGTDWQLATDHFLENVFCSRTEIDRNRSPVVERSSQAGWIFFHSMGTHHLALGICS
jgi:hypothetical protein